jgi:hypothetical protein
LRNDELFQSEFGYKKAFSDFLILSKQFGELKRTFVVLLSIKELSKTGFSAQLERLACAYTSVCRV